MEPLTPAPVVLNPYDIDEYCSVRIQREALEKREKLLKDKLDACIPPSLADSDPWTFNGDKYVIGVTARGWQRTLNSIGKLFRRLGYKTFFAHCRFALGDFDRLVPEGEQAAFVTSKQSGPRQFRVVKKFITAS